MFFQLILLYFKIHLKLIETFKRVETYVPLTQEV